MSLDETFPPGSNEWLEDFQAKSRAIIKSLREIRARFEEITRRLRIIIAENTLRNIRRDNDLRKEYIGKLYDPFYEPTPVDEIVIQQLLEEEDDKNGEGP